MSIHQGFSTPPLTITMPIISTATSPMISTTTTTLSPTSTIIFYLSPSSVTTIINIDKKINTLDYVTPLRIFHSNVNNHHATLATTTLPIISTSTTLSPTSTYGDMFFYQSNIGIPNLTLLTIEKNITIPPLTATFNDIRDDITNSSIQINFTTIFIVY